MDDLNAHPRKRMKSDLSHLRTNIKLMFILMAACLLLINIRIILKRPFLFPVYAPNGSVITRGFPLNQEKEKGLIIRTILEYGLTTEM